MEIHWAIAPTSFGSMLVAATGKGVCRLSFDEGGETLERRFPKHLLTRDGDAIARLLPAIVKAVEDPAIGGRIPLDIGGTPFQRAVWDALCEIPAGETRSYAQIAGRIGNPGAVRAVGLANGANPVAVLIPCHRVVRTGGGLGGYAYGLAIKRALLAREGGRLHEAVRIDVHANPHAGGKAQRLQPAGDDLLQFR